MISIREDKAQWTDFTGLEPFPVLKYFVDPFASIYLLGSWLYQPSLNGNISKVARVNSTLTSKLFQGNSISFLMICGLINFEHVLI